MNKNDWLDVYAKDILKQAQEYLLFCFPRFFSKKISVNINYLQIKGKTEIYYEYNDGLSEIIIKTPEKLNGLNLKELKNKRTNFLVFKNQAGNKKILKRVQDRFFIMHELIHVQTDYLLKKYRPELFKIKKSYSENDIFPILLEGIPISLEYIMSQKMLDNNKIVREEKNDIKLFWDIHEKYLLNNALEKNPKSKYCQHTEAMIFYKIYEASGEKGILDFLKEFNYQKLAKIKRYKNIKKQIINHQYKVLMDMQAEEIFRYYV